MVTPFNTPDATKALAMDVRGVAPADVVPDALILTTSTKAGVVEGDAPVVRVPFISLEGAPGFVAEAAEIPESLPDDTEADIATGKIAVLVPVSREILAQPDAGSLLNAAVRKAMTRKANRAYLAQAAPVAPATRPPAGILNQAITDGGALGTDLDGLVDAIAAIEDAGARPPTSWPARLPGPR